MSAGQVDQNIDGEDNNCETEWVAPPPSTIAESIDVGRELRLLKTLVDFKCGDKPRPPFRYPKPVGAWRRRKRKKGVSGSGYTCPFRIRLLARPLERHILLTLENYGHLLPPHVVEAMRRSLGEEPTFTPKEAYGFFKQFYRKRKNAERAKRRRENKLEPAMRPCTKHQITFIRRASIMFARCLQGELIQQRIFVLSGSHILLSNVILHELCGYMKMLTPCRADPRPKQQFMMELADRITAWIDQILVDAGLRMLFVDEDEDEDISTEEEDNKDEEVDGEGDNYLDAGEELPEADNKIHEGGGLIKSGPDDVGQIVKQEITEEGTGTILTSVLSIHLMESEK